MNTSPFQNIASDATSARMTEEQRVRFVALLPTVPADIAAGFVYDRKGYDTVDVFGGHINPSYRGSNDDILIQVTHTYRIARDQDPETYARLLETDTQFRQEDAQKAKAEALQMVERAQAALAEAEARLQATQP